MATFPESPPFICEAITDAYGTWHNGGDPALSGIDLSTSVFDTRKAGNHASIRKWQTGYNPGVDGALFFEFNTPIDFSQYDALIFSHLNSPSNPYLRQFLLFLEDVNGKWSTAQTWTGPGTFSDVQLYIQNFGASDAGFDIAQVKRVTIFSDATASDTWPKYHFVDWMYLYRAPVQYQTRVNAVEDVTGKALAKSVTIIDPYYGSWTAFTPLDYAMAQENGTQYILQADPDRFLRWENGSTNPNRTYTPVDSRTLTATYEPIIRFTLKISSDPSGKSVKIDGAQGNTPWTVTVSPGTYTVELIDKTDFTKWEDNTTNPVRTITVNKNMEITAYYGGAGPDGEEEPLWIKVVKGAVAGLVIGIIVRQVT